MGNPYYDTVNAGSMDPSQAAMPQGPGMSYPAPQPQATGTPYPNPMEGVGSAGGAYQNDLGNIRNSIMQQFPDLLAPDEPAPEMDATQKLTMFGLFLADPKGALNIVQQRRKVQAERQKLRAEMALKATGVAGTILKAQADTQEAMLKMHLDMNHDWRNRKTQEFNENIATQRLALEQASKGLEARKYADQQQFQQGIVDELHSSTDAGGNPVSTPGLGTPGGRVTTSLTPHGAGITIAPPAAGRDPRVDYDAWLKSRFGSLGPPSKFSTEDLVAMYQRERATLAGVQPGSFGAASGSPIGGAGLLFNQADTSGDGIE